MTIVASACRAGFRVTLRQEDLGSVSPGTQVAICRVVREGLANSARYAGSTQVDVHIARATRRGQWIPVEGQPT